GAEIDAAHLGDEATVLAACAFFDEAYALDVLEQAVVGGKLDPSPPVADALYILDGGSGDDFERDRGDRFSDVLHHLRPLAFAEFNVEVGRDHSSQASIGEDGDAAALGLDSLAHFAGKIGGDA